MYAATSSRMLPALEEFALLTVSFLERPLRAFAHRPTNNRATPATHSDEKMLITMYTFSGAARLGDAVSVSPTWVTR